MIESGEELLRRRGALGTFGADVGQDVRYALRSMRRRPGFTFLAVLPLALGIGANTALFSVLHAVLLRPLPYPESERLMTVWTPWVGDDYNPLSTPNYLDYRDQTSSFSSWGVYTARKVNLAASENPDQIFSIACTHGVLHALGIEPTVGRLFTADDESAGSERVALISHEFWKDRFACDPGLVGRTITIDGESHTVIGIMPDGFVFPEIWDSRIPGLWFPLVLSRDGSDRDSHWLRSIGRLRTDVTLDQSREDFASVAARLAAAWPDANSQRLARVVPLKQVITEDYSSTLWILMGAVGFVLLITCANVAGLLLARGTVRQTELAVRAAIGAARFRLARQLLTESLVLASAGGLLGVLLVVWGIAILPELIPSSLPRLAGLQANAPVFLFAVAITLLAGLLFGLAPVLLSSHIELTRFLHAGGRGGSLGRRQGRILSALVVVQFALALVLANGANLMLQSLARATHDPELREPDQVILASLALQGPEYETDRQKNIFWDRFSTRLRSLPGVESVSACSHLPLYSNSTGTILVEEEEFDAETTHPLNAFIWVTPDYFRTIGLHLIAGRTFEERDEREGSLGVIVNRTLSERYWPGGNPIGKRIRSNTVPSWFEATIVGVVEDVRQWGLEYPVFDGIYFPFAHYEWPERWLAVRTGNDPYLTLPAIQRELAAVDRNIALTGIRTGSDLYAGAARTRRSITVLAGSFTLIALLLVSAGTFGVMSIQVARRTHEIGVRLALGAENRQVLTLVLRRGLRLSLCGIGTGILLALVTASIMRQLLYQVSPLNLFSLVLMIALLVVIALLASAGPARRASRLDPVRALESE